MKRAVCFRFAEFIWAVFAFCRFILLWVMLMKAKTGGCMGFLHTFAACFRT